MRRVALVLVMCGCNQVYDLEPTRVRDAGISDAGDRVIRLGLMIGGTTTTGSQAPIVYQALPDAAIALGLLDEPMREVAYTPTADGGLVDYPFGFGEKTWRLEYNPPFDVLHEVQWDPSAGVGFVTVPVVGRPDRVPSPAAAGYALSMQPSGNPYAFSDQTIVYTTGYWSAKKIAAPSTTPEVTFDASPSAAAGDLVVAVDYTLEATSGCTRAVISGSRAAPPLEAGMMKPVELVADFAANVPGMLTYLGEIPSSARTRLRAAVGATTDPVGRTRFGRIAHNQMPAFTTSHDDVPAPPLIQIFDCPIDVAPIANSNGVSGAAGFTTVFHGMVTSDRTVEGVRLRSSLSFIARALGALYVANLEVPLATDIRIDGGLIAPGGTLSPTARALSFAFDNPAYLADYYEVTLYRLEAGALVPIRVYVGLDVTAPRPTIRIDPALVAPSATHVFAIRSYRGRPRAAIGDFRFVDYLQSAGTVFTNTFHR